MPKARLAKQSIVNHLPVRLDKIKPMHVSSCVPRHDLEKQAKHTPDMTTKD